MAIPSYRELQKQLQGNGMRQIFVWQGPGYYGPVQTGSYEETRIEMVFVCAYARDSIELERAKRDADVMSVAYYASQPEPSAEEKKILAEIEELRKLIAEYWKWLPMEHGHHQNPYELTLGQLQSAIVSEQWRRACYKSRR